MGINSFLPKGRKSFENTKEFKRHKHKVLKEIRLKYKELIIIETNYVKKLVLLIKREREIKKQIKSLNPLESLFNK